MNNILIYKAYIISKTKVPLGSTHISLTMRALSFSHSGNNVCYNIKMERKKRTTIR
jgi:hypothetical protein